MHFIWGVLPTGFTEPPVLKLNIMQSKDFRSIAFEEAVEMSLGLMTHTVRR